MSFYPAQIEEKASALLAAPRFQVSPIDVIGVAESLDIQVSGRPMEDQASGMLVVNGNVSHIIYNSSHHPNRQRFTIAHEIGHFVLHHTALVNRLFVDEKFAVYKRSGASTAAEYLGLDSTTTPSEEREANQFASALLMPESRLRSYLEDRQLTVLDDSDLSALARAFGVSEQAMTLRATRLELIQPTDC